jgi:hypothetical protein
MSSGNVWDGNNITLDETWGPVPYLKPSQTIAGAVMIMGDSTHDYQRQPI